MKAAAPQAEAFVATPQGRRRATQLITTNFEYITADLLAYYMLAIASSNAAGPLIENALHEGWTLDAERITCPKRIVWGTGDKLLPWPHAASRYRMELPPDGLGSVGRDRPQPPSSTSPSKPAHLILGFIT